MAGSERPLAMNGLFHSRSFEWIIRVSEKCFYLLFQERIGGTGVFHKGRSLIRIILFDGIGQDRLYLLPTFRSHLGWGMTKLD
jgi:hypothetical protein